MITIRATALALLLLASPTSIHAQPAPRETVDQIAQRIREAYFDPARADEIADALEADARSGQFDTLVEPLDLATALTRRLAAIDAHFSVRYGQEEAGRPTSGPTLNPISAEGRGNYGFRRVEVLAGNIGYIDLRLFNFLNFNDPDDPARRAADAALDFVAGTDAVILDLRQNGGGAPAMVGYLASAFTPANAPIYNVFHSREGTSSEAPSVYRPDPRLDVPLYILISARTGSAGEALPYTLQAAGRAVIVGEASAGGANPGGRVQIPGGFSIFISTGSPRNPITGRNWEGVGVLPDVAVPATQALDRAYVLALEQSVATDRNGRADAIWALEAMTASPASEDLTGFVGEYGDLRVTLDGDRLALIRGRRMPAFLKSLGGGVFSLVDDPGIRVHFAGADGVGTSGYLDLITVRGATTRHRRRN